VDSRLRAAKTGPLGPNRSFLKNPFTQRALAFASLAEIGKDEAHDVPGKAR